MRRLPGIVAASAVFVGALTRFRQAGAQQVGTTICACSPSVYNFQLHFDYVCNQTNVEGPGVADWDCFSQGLGPGKGNVTDFVPVRVSSIDIIELDQGLAPIASTFYGAGYNDGDVIKYTSIAGSTGNASALTPAQLPKAIQLSIVGRNQLEEDITNVWIILFDNNCGYFQVLQTGDQIGWTKLLGLDPPLEVVCPQTVSPGPTAGGATSEPTPIICPPTLSPVPAPTHPSGSFSKYYSGSGSGGSKVGHLPSSKGSGSWRSSSQSLSGHSKGSSEDDAFMSFPLGVKSLKGKGGKGIKGSNSHGLSKGSKGASKGLHPECIDPSKAAKKKQPTAGGSKRGSKLHKPTPPKTGGSKVAKAKSGASKSGASLSSKGSASKASSSSKVYTPTHSTAPSVSKSGGGASGSRSGSSSTASSKGGFDSPVPTRLPAQHKRAGAPVTSPVHQQNNDEPEMRRQRQRRTLTSLRTYADKPSQPQRHRSL